MKDYSSLLCQGRVWWRVAGGWRHEHIKLSEKRMGRNVGRNG